MRYIIILLLLGIVYSCSTPEKALSEGKYNKAFSLAKKKVYKGKDVDKNIEILRASGVGMIETIISNNEQLLHSDKVHNWIKVRKSYYALLDKIGKVNKELDGSISDVYDQLCTPKIDLDFKIANVFYEKGLDFMDAFDRTGNKVEARSAYYEFNKCKLNGGKAFFNNLEDYQQEALEEGIVYFVGDYSNYNIFIQPLPQGADFGPDCEVRSSFDFIQKDESSSNSSTTYSVKVQVDTRIETDTSGVQTHIPVYEDVTCEVTTTTVKLTYRQSAYLYVTDLTGQCSIYSSSVSESVSDSYELVDVSGDDRAVPSGVREESSAPAFIESNLEEALGEAVRGALY